MIGWYSTKYDEEEVKEEKNEEELNAKKEDTN